MKRFDLKHTAFHILVALYFIWAFVFAILLAMAVANALSANDAALSRIFLIWICMNLFTGSALFVVIRLFRRSGIIARTILLSYISLSVGGLGVMLYIAMAA